MFLINMAYEKVQEDHPKFTNKKNNLDILYLQLSIVMNIDKLIKMRSLKSELGSIS
jgi:hypothetical protein